jgi:hypothetical protein
MSCAASTKNTSWFWRIRSWVVPSSRSFGPGTSKSLMPMPSVVLKSGPVGAVSLENRIQAG